LVSFTAMAAMGVPRRRRQRSAAILGGSSPLVAAAAAAATTIAAGTAQRLHQGPSHPAAFVPVASVAGGCSPIQAARVAGSLPSLAQHVPSSRFQVVRIGSWATRAILSVAAAAGVVALRAKGGEYESRTVAELKSLLKDQGLPVSGTKAELVKRLNEASEHKGAKGGKAAPTKAGSKTTKAKKPKKVVEEEEDEEDEEEADEDKDGEEPEAGYIEDPHTGKPETIVDSDGRTRYLCMDGQYRRGDPDAIECKQENFHAWLSEWIVAARTGQLEGKPQKTFLAQDPKSPGNPEGKSQTAGEVIRSEEVLARVEDGPNGAPRWESK